MVWRPVRRRSLTSAGSRPSAASGRASRALAELPGAAIAASSDPNRASAAAAPLVSAMPTRAVIRRSAARSRIVAAISGSPPKRWAQPAMSRSRPSGGSRETRGENRSAHRHSARRRISSRAGSAGSVRRDGQMARASARERPGDRPASRAASERWVSRQALRISATMAKAPSVRASPRRMRRSSGS